MRERPSRLGQSQVPSHQRNQGPIASTQRRTMRRSSQGNVQLMPKKEILDFKPLSRLEQTGDKCRKQMDDGKHRTG